MKLRNIITGLLVFLTLYYSSAVRAAAPAMSTPIEHPWGFSASFSAGWGLKVDRPSQVEALGYYDSFGDGLYVDHAVGLFRVSDAQLLASAIVSSSDIRIDKYRYASIPQVTLQVGQEYFIAGFNPRWPGYPFDELSVASVSATSFLPGVIFLGWQIEDSSSLQFTEYNLEVGPWAASNGYLVAANLLLSPVSEPAEYSLFGVGLIFLVHHAKRRARSSSARVRDKEIALAR